MRFKWPVNSLSYDSSTQRPVVNFTPGTGSSSVEFDAVIVATSTRVMDTIGLTRPAPGGDLLPQSVKVAMRNLHMTNSSKLFIRTPTKFWLNDPTMPKCILTDELPRATYVLDYATTNNGVVCVSYKWEDDSTLLQALDKQARFQKFKAIISTINPAFGAALTPVTPDDIFSVDWQSEQGYQGAFKLNYPGQEPELRAAYSHFLTVLTPNIDTGVYIAGDGVSYSGGWTEGALQTALNAATAVARRFKGALPSYNALMQNPNLYDYGSRPGSLPRANCRMIRMKAISRGVPICRPNRWPIGNWSSPIGKASRRADRGRTIRRRWIRLRRAWTSSCWPSERREPTARSTRHF